MLTCTNYQEWVMLI
jgi:hypothetical protein